MTALTCRWHDYTWSDHFLFFLNEIFISFVERFNLNKHGMATEYDDEQVLKETFEDYLSTCTRPSKRHTLFLFWFIFELTLLIVGPDIEARLSFTSDWELPNGRPFPKAREFYHLCYDARQTFVRLRLAGQFSELPPTTWVATDVNGVVAEAQSEHDLSMKIIVRRACRASEFPLPVILRR